MKLYRIYGLLLKSYYVTRRSPDRMADVFYWSVIDLIIWGLTSSYFTQLAPHSNILQIIISGLLFWTVVWRGQQEISVNLLEDLWNKNLVNIFVSPLSFFEWIISFFIISIIKSILSFAIGSTFAYFVYHVNVFFYGWYLFLFCFILLLNGWWIGFLVSGLILRLGTKIQNISWSLITLFSPFSAIYYPIAILPLWAQYIAKIFPTSYVFAAIHTMIQTGKPDVASLEISLALTLVYLSASLIFIWSSFKAVLQKGLVKIF